jgi:hypothetical protein
LAKYVSETPLSDDEILIGKATFEDCFPEKPTNGNNRLVDGDPAYKGKAPLWCYVLAESINQWMKDVKKQGKTGDAADQIGVTLGPVGGRIDAETLIGLVAADSRSYLNHADASRPSRSRTELS